MAIPLTQRFTGAVLGAAIGDALGAPVEFIGSQAEIQRRFPPHGVTDYVAFIEADGQRVAPYTDDTQMAELVLQTMLDADAAGEHLDLAMTALARAFIGWAEAPQGGHRAPGNACLAGCARLRAGVPWQQAGASDAGGCGSVMRAYPAGLRFWRAPQVAITWAVAQSRLTHNHPMALAACAGMAAAMASVLADATPAAVVRAAGDAAHAFDPSTATMLAGAAADAESGAAPDTVLDRLRGWRADECLAAALFVFLRYPDDFRAGVLLAVNTPGDSDSIATLTGALLGARLGEAAIPRPWQIGLERSAELRALALALAAVAG
jgi:ADP-ribosylglycohydrolase